MIQFVRWASPRHPDREDKGERDRNQSKWHLIDKEAERTFCGRDPYTSAVLWEFGKPEVRPVQLYPLRVVPKRTPPQPGDESYDICAKCAASRQLWKELRRTMGL